MSGEAGNQIRKIESSPQITREDFINVLCEDMNGLYQLSFLLTEDQEKHKIVLQPAFEDCVQENRVFREWASSRAECTLSERNWWRGKQ